MTFLIADGVVPSNEDRGYVLRRLMRRAIQQGHRLGIEPGFLPQYVTSSIDLMGAGYPELQRERETIHKWVARRGGELRAHARQGTQAARGPARGRRGRRGDDAFRLHDTFGFPIELTREIAADAACRSRTSGVRRAHGASSARGRAPAGGGAPFAGELSRRRAEPDDVHRLRAPRAAHDGPAGERERAHVLKLAESPFYAAGGGQVADTGVDRLRGRRLPRARRRRRARGRRPGDRRRAGRGRAEAPASASSRASTAPRATRPRPTTPPRTCCTPRCARASGPTSTRRAPTSGPTSCASTSPTPSA